MIPLVGYADRLSARPGETLTFHVSNATGEPVSATLVRVICADANPAGPGIQLEAVANGGLKQTAAPGACHVDQGSFARVAMKGRLRALTSFSIIATVWPTRLGRSIQPVLGWYDDRAHTGFTLAIGPDGHLTFLAGDGKTWLEGPDGTPRVSERTWAKVWCSYEAATGVITVGSGGKFASATLTRAVAAATGDTLVIAASPGASFDGKIERPMLFDRALSASEIEAALKGNPPASLVAAWDFAKAMHGDEIVDVGPHGLNGTLVNTPARAMTGSTWSGREMCYRHAPEQYAAIHFHSDDIEDCRWPATHEFKVPDGMKTGSYALLLEAGREKENIPFFIVPPKGKASAKIAVLVSTFTYTIYHNHARPEWMKDHDWKTAWEKQSAAWPGAYPHNPGAHPEYGWSTYNFHADGSGIHTASWRRPMLNVRIGYITYPYPDIRASGLRHYPADSHLLAWMEKKGYAFDLITDWELHTEGYDLLKNYTVVMTGSHPEYHTAEMLDALETYRDNGGRFIYLGGNGFYWKVALNPARPGQIEIRRAEGGIRAWAAEPGEYYNQFDGEYGGLWRRNGRPPQKLCGVGFTAQGNFVGSYYRISEDGRRDKRVSWMLDGIKEEVVGDFGLSGHGAAGFELDRVDYRLGTPRHAVVVGRSENHPPEAPWVVVPEEQLTHITTITGETHKQLIHADLTFFETPGNGAVFSTGSITFCGSLPANNYDNNISRLLANVIDRFSDPAATFEMPA